MYYFSLESKQIIPTPTEEKLCKRMLERTHVYISGNAEILEKVGMCALCVCVCRGGGGRGEGSVGGGEHVISHR